MADANGIGRYDVLEQLATRGTGSVYLAKGTGPAGFERHVVVKLLDDEGALAEARVVGRMHHQHIVAAHELGRDERGRYYLVMDYVHGQTAEAIWARTRELDLVLPLSFTLTTVTAAASALHYARSVERLRIDISLSNLMIGYDGAIKLIDFGIAHDDRADVVSLGIVLYELATATRADTDRAKIVPPTRLVADFPQELEAIILGALQVDPAARIEDAEAMRRRLEAFARRLKLVVGDAAILPVMEVLFEQRPEPWRPIEAVPQAKEDVPTMPLNAPLPVRTARVAEEVVDVPTGRFDARADDASTRPFQPVDAPATYPRGTTRRSMVAASVWRRWLWVGPPAVIALALVAVYVRPVKTDGAAGGVAMPALPVHPPPVITPIAADPVPTAAHPKTIRIHITTSPEDATVLLDGERLGHTPFDGAATAADGPHTIKIRRRGYLPQKLEVDLRSDITLDLALQPFPASDLESH